MIEAYWNYKNVIPTQLKDKITSNAVVSWYCAQETLNSATSKICVKYDHDYPAVVSSPAV